MDYTTLFTNAIDHWRDNKGVGTALIPAPLNDKAMVLGVLQKVYNKRPDTICIIVVNNFTERNELIEYLTHQEDEDNNKEFKDLIEKKKLKIFTINFIEKAEFIANRDLTILYHPTTLTTKLCNITKYAKFRLAVLNSLSMTSDNLNKLYSLCPLLSDFKQNEIDALRISTPVEEMRLCVDIPTETEVYKLMLYYDEYIATTINIFGSFDNIQYARVGDPRCNMSANTFCYNLALENGWSENLDMSVELNTQIDAIYSPSAIRDRAMQAYEIIRKRAKLLADYDGKLDTIFNIVEENKDKHILIINKFGEFAAKVTKYINDMSEKEICGNYHNMVEPIPACTVDGTPIYIKSGPQKGERRMFADKAQKTYNEERFNLGYINILSTNNTPDKELSIPIDIVIITSPLCEEIESYIYRLSNVWYPNNNIKLYALYVKDSIEEKRIQSKRISETHLLSENAQKSENLDKKFDFVVAD